jgi:hypothetical protein
MLIDVVEVRDVGRVGGKRVYVLLLGKEGLGAVRPAEVGRCV